MKLSHISAAVSASFDDDNLVSAAGLVPIIKLAEKAAGADSIDDMSILRHGGMAKLFTAIYASSTLASFLRAFTFGHVRQLGAVAWRFLVNLVG